ncbi:MAG: LPD7 domain-containing protein [Nitrobacter sp.]
MNATANDKEEFIVERRGRAGRDSDMDRSGGQKAVKETPTEKVRSATIELVGIPDRIRRKYYVVSADAGKEGVDGAARVYADERGEYLAFKIAGDRLVTRLTAAEVIRDMISIAKHRNWEALQVRGSAEFRREAWLEASARGIEAKGYEPTELDRQALATRREAWGRAHTREREVDARPASSNGDKSATFDYDAGVSGRLIEVGRAPYLNRNDAETSTYVTLELDNGKQHQVWGGGLGKATADSNAKPDDRIHVRRNGVEHVSKDIKVIDPATGTARIEQRQVPRNRWRITAEKFRSADRQSASRDPDLVTAESQIAIIEKTLKRAFPQNERAQRGVMEAVRERIGRHLEQGHSFPRATVEEFVQEHNRSKSGKDDAHQNQRRGRIPEKER